MNNDLCWWKVEFLEDDRYHPSCFYVRAGVVEKTSDNNIRIDGCDLIFGDANFTPNDNVSITKRYGSKVIKHVLKTCGLSFTRVEDWIKLETMLPGVECVPCYTPEAAIRHVLRFKHGTVMYEYNLLTDQLRKTKAKESIYKCVARRYSDQMICESCNLVWDVNDPDPPECKQNTTQSSH